MTSAQFRALGEALRGPAWKRAIAKDLGRNEREVKYWASGGRDVPDEVAAALRELLRAHLAKLRKLAF